MRTSRKKNITIITAVFIVIAVMVLLLFPIGAVAAQDPPPFIGVGFGGTGTNTPDEELFIVFYLLNAQDKYYYAEILDPENEPLTLNFPTKYIEDSFWITQPGTDVHTVDPVTKEGYYTATVGIYDDIEYVDGVPVPVGDPYNTATFIMHVWNHVQDLELLEAKKTPCLDVIVEKDDNICFYFNVSDSIDLSWQLELNKAGYNPLPGEVSYWKDYKGTIIEDVWCEVDNLPPGLYSTALDIDMADDNQTNWLNINQFGIDTKGNLILFDETYGSPSEQIYLLMEIANSMGLSTDTIINAENAVINGDFSGAIKYVMDFKDEINQIPDRVIDTLKGK